MSHLFRIVVDVAICVVSFILVKTLMKIKINDEE